MKTTDFDTAGGDLASVASAPAARVSSPVATGGAGTTFEQHVGAYWLAQLLVGAIPPILINATVQEVSFQTERLGWQTDDLLVICTSGGVERKLAGQVKRAFTVSASDKECAQTVTDFWKDFHGPHFSKDHDRLSLITLRGTNTLLEHFVALLDCARASRDGSEFEQRLATSNFISSTAARYCGELQSIIGGIEAKLVKAADLWPLLRVLHVLSLDLNTSTGQTEAHIKSMLALTASDGDPLASAAASWNELVAEASAAMVASRSLRRDDLPAPTRARHGPIGGNERRVLQTLEEHTTPVLRAIRSTLGGSRLHLSRAPLVQKVLDSLETAQVVLVTGPAGSGKSAIAKDAVGALAPNHFRFALRVEEFAQPHLDATLGLAGVPANWERLRAILAAQDRKVVLVESVERLLEKTTRDAFADLMMLAADDAALRVVLTCRDYSSEQVRASFLQPHRIKHTILRVPPLDDAELAEVEAAYPSIAGPVKNPALRRLLQNPFVLDKALDIGWSDENTLPQNEREFRAVFWREIVRGSTPATRRLREEGLQIVAVRRARALSAHVPTSDLDPSVVESLRADSLIASPEGKPLLVTTAHDVLEDWAILQWLEDQHIAEVSFTTLAEAIGPHPAVRRCYRKWLAELIDRDVAAADRLFQAAVSDTEISMQFRDDTLVSLLKAPSAPAFLSRNVTQLLADDHAVLKRVIHLLRVACVKTPERYAGLAGGGSIFNVPDGTTWASVLRLVHDNLAIFADNEKGLLLGLVEDAVRSVTWWTPDVDGAEDVAGIAYWLLDGVRGYGDEDTRKRILKVVAKVPKADPARFEATLRGRLEEGQRRDVVAEDLRALIFGGTDGLPAARDLPEVVIAVGSDYLLASEEDIDDERRYARLSLDINLYFGIKEELRYRSTGRPSAICGPWVHLLRQHPWKALDFYAKVFRHSIDWYAHPRVHSRLEAAWEVELRFPDGGTHKQWANGRLWGMYRGMTVGPDQLKSMLMALESWLLDVGKGQPAMLDNLLLKVLRSCDNASLAAVVASVAMAYPHSAGETLLVLLSVRDYITLDRHRVATDGKALALAGMFPALHANDQLYEAERKEANTLAHRQRDLENAVLNFQVGPLAPRVQALLDEHLAALPPKDEQDKNDLTWRLALHRMDLRQYAASEMAPDSSAPEATQSGQREGYVRLDLRPPEADVQAIVDESTSQLAVFSNRLGLLMWGVAAFQRETGKYDPTAWSAKISEAQATEVNFDDPGGTGHGPGFIAAVCIRDHWDDMTLSQRNWCVDTACREVLRHSNDADYMERIQNNAMAADRACAFVLPLLLGKQLESATARVKSAFAAALTHPVEEVMVYATWGIDEAVWTRDRQLALRCVNAIATEAAAIERALKADRKRTYDEGRLQKIMSATAARVRADFWEESAFADDAHVTLDISGGFGADALKHILVILGRVPQDGLAVAAYTRASQVLASWWTSDDDRRGRNDRNFHAEADLSRHIQEFLLRTSREAALQVLEPLLAVINDHPSELQSVVEGLTGTEDAKPNTPQYWFLWEQFASAVKRAKWVSHLGKNRNSDGSGLLSAIFLTSYWKKDVRHWRSLDGYAHLVHTLFEELPPSSVVLDLYARFLYYIGERSLPEAFLRIARALDRGDPRRMLTQSNTVFMLEVLLQRHVYGRPLDLKRDARMRDAALLILDWLVEVGSSAAFRMRDDFVTPASSAS